MKTKILIIVGLVIAIAVIAVLTVCQGPESSGPPLDRETFVQLYVDLEMIAEQAGIGTPEYDARRDSVLEAYNTNFDDVTGMLKAYDDNPEQWAVVWEDILAELERRKENLDESDTLSAP